MDENATLQELRSPIFSLQALCLVEGRRLWISLKAEMPQTLSRSERCGFNAICNEVVLQSFHVHCAVFHVAIKVWEVSVEGFHSCLVFFASSPNIVS